MCSVRFLEVYNLGCQIVLIIDFELGSNTFHLK